MIEAYFALIRDQFEVIRALIDEGNMNSIFDVDVSEKVPAVLHNKPTLLCVASYFGAKRCLDYLISIGCDVNMGDQSSPTIQPVHFAIAGNHIGILQKLVSNGAICKGLVFYSMRFDNMVCLEYILENNLENVNDMFENLNMLEYSLKEKGLHYPSLLLKNGATFSRNLFDEYKKNGPVFDLLKSYQMQMIGFAVSHRCYLVDAAAAGDFETVRKLIVESKADPNEVNEHGDNAFIKGAAKGCVPVLYFFAKMEGFDVNHANIGGVCFSFIELHFMKHAIGEREELSSFY